MHSVIMDSVSVSAAKDLVRLTAPAATVATLTKPSAPGTRLRVKYISVKQDTAASPQTCLVAVYRASDTGTGTATNATTFEAQPETFQGSAVVNLTADTTKSPTEPLISESALLTDGWYWESLSDEDDIEIPPGGHFVVRLDSAPSGATVMSVAVRFKQAT